METLNLRFMPNHENISSDYQYFKPENFPPNDDWVMSVDRQGNILSRFGDDFWDYRYFSNPITFNFDRHGLSESNKNFVKQMMFLVIYHPFLYPGTTKSCIYCFYCLVKIAKVCSDNQLLVEDLPKFPKIFPLIEQALQAPGYKASVSFLHRLSVHAGDLGIGFISEPLLRYLAKKIRTWESIQTAYIPPRIWSYQVNRLNECLNDFLESKKAISDAFVWLLKAHRGNNSIPKSPSTGNSPFVSEARPKGFIKYPGDFETFIQDYNIKNVIRKWIGPKKNSGSRAFSKYLNLVRDASLFYILNFSLQRAEEANSLRTGCFNIEMDEKLGEIALLVGETTKTDPDADARWVVHNSVKKAVEVATIIAELRMLCIETPTEILSLGKTQNSVSLSLSATEPWAVVASLNKRKSAREHKTKSRYQPFLNQYPLVFDQERILTNEEDWKVAISMTPNLGKDERFGIGLPWHFSAHQLRRTTAVNMFASNMVSDSSLQWSLKHLNRNMTLYYARNYSNLRLNSDAETLLLIEAYNSVYTQLTEVVNDELNYVRPHKNVQLPNQIIQLVESKDEKTLLKLIEKGAVDCRRTFLGFCMKQGPCEYGGIESVSKCAIGDGGGICVDAIFDRKNETELRSLKHSHLQQISTLAPTSIRRKALGSEVNAIEVYLDAIKK